MKLKRYLKYSRILEPKQYKSIFQNKAYFSFLFIDFCQSVGFICLDINAFKLCFGYFVTKSKEC